MEAEVAPKSTTLVFVVVSALNAVLLLVPALWPAWEIVEHSFSPGALPGFVRGLIPLVACLGISIVTAIVLALLFARRLVKLRAVRPEPNPRVWATLGGSALLVLALQGLFWGLLPLFTWALNAAGYMSYYEAYRGAGLLFDLAVTSKGIGPAFLLILAGLLLVICFGMTRPRTVYLDENHEVWEPPPRKE
ncbi:MAG: hypothetical protein R6V12_01340 [Candidatus Hydrogenedentota bacterium]